MLVEASTAATGSRGLILLAVAVFVGTVLTSQCSGTRPIGGAFRTCP